MCSPALVNVQGGRQGRTGLVFPLRNRLKVHQKLTVIMTGYKKLGTLCDRHPVR